MKKKITVALICILFIGGCSVCYSQMRTLDFHAITKNMDQKVMSVTDGSGDTIPVEEALGRWSSGKYKRYRGSVGNTAHRSYIFYGESMDELFTLTDMGNRNIIGITIDGEKKYIGSINEQDCP